MKRVSLDKPYVWRGKRKCLKPEYTFSSAKPKKKAKFNAQSLSLMFLGISLLCLIFMAGCAGGVPEAPAAPESTGISATPVEGGIQVTWRPSQATDTTGYNLYRSREAGILGEKINPVLITDNSYLDSSVSSGAVYYYTVRAMSATGAENQNLEQASATAQTDPPSSLSIQINGGAAHTATPQVTLTLYALNAAECRVSNDKNTWSAWQPYTTSMSWELTPGDGIKDVYYECKDSLGNTATSVSASITLDSSNPTVNILSPKEGETYNSPFDLSLIITDASTKQVTCSGNLDGGPTTIGYLDVGIEDTMSIATTPGYHTLEITCNDGVNSNTATASFYITNQPTVEIVINGGATYANSQVVDIQVTASSDVVSCHFSNEERMWDAWVPYTEHGLWVLSAGDGFKTVYAQCRNTEGIDSEIASDSIYLDTRYQKPISIEIDNGDGWTNSRDVTLGLYCSGASECRYRNKDEDWSGWSSYTTKKYWTLSSDEGEKTVYYNCRDYKGKDLGTAQATIEYSEKNPDSPSSLSIKINNGASHTKERDVQLTLKAKNADACKYKNEGGSWTDYESYRTSKSWTLTEGEGKKTVYYKCKNDYGYAETSTSIYLDGTAPGPIDSLTAYVDYNEVVHLAWDRPTGTISEYQIYRSTSGLGEFTKIGSTQTTTYQDKTALEGYTYSYSVRAMDSAGNIAPDSNIATIEIPAEAGGDEDEHGCVGSAGYEWCESLGECIRPWETECP